MQVINCKTLKTFALVILFFLFLAPSTSLRVNSKRNKKTPGCIIDSFHYFFRSLIFARLRCAKNQREAKKSGTWNQQSKAGFLILSEREPRTNAVPIWVNAFFRGARWNGWPLRKKQRVRAIVCSWFFCYFF